jgi:NitT/TauT family transport system substrate-binding protein
VVDSALDRPWSQYFCCMMVSGREFPRKHPVAAKRAIRAIVKANAICAQEPERVARLLVDKGVVKRHDYALRLHEAGLVKSSPSKLLAQGSELRFVKELKKELKG